MKRVKNNDGTVTATMDRKMAFDIIDELLKQIKENKEVIQLTICDNYKEDSLFDILEKNQNN
jgi:hypothetical protein